MNHLHPTADVRYCEILFLRQSMLPVVLLSLLRHQSYHAVHFLVSCHSDWRETDFGFFSGILVEELKHHWALADSLVWSGRPHTGQLVHRRCGLARPIDASHL